MSASFAERLASLRGRNVEIEGDDVGPRGLGGPAPARTGPPGGITAALQMRLGQPSGTSEARPRSELPSATGAGATTMRPTSLIGGIAAAFPARADRPGSGGRGSMVPTRLDQAALGGATEPRGVGPAARGATASWRQQVVTWAREAIAGAPDVEPPAIPEVASLARRFELPDSLIPAIALLYGQHLDGEHGAAPDDVACVLGRNWDEALGRGVLAARGVAVYGESRVALAAPLVRVLNELPPLAGALHGAPGPSALLGPCVVVAAASEPIAAIAARCAAQIGGAVLAGKPGVDRAALSLEARARGAAPLWRIAAGEPAPDEPAIVVVPDEASAEQLGLPRLA